MRSADIMKTVARQNRNLILDPVLHLISHLRGAIIKKNGKNWEKFPNGGEDG